MMMRVTIAKYIIIYVSVFYYMQVSFVGEEGEDVGGVKKEFFSLVLQKILNPDFGMFVEDDESHNIWFRDNVRGVVCFWWVYKLSAIYTLCVKCMAGEKKVHDKGAE